jgi:hypothetical protein
MKKGPILLLDIFHLTVMFSAIKLIVTNLMQHTLSFRAELDYVSYRVMSTIKLCTSITLPKRLARHQRDE